MRRAVAAILGSLVILAGIAMAPSAQAQVCTTADPTAPCIAWEVKHRFRLFKREQDFAAQVAAQVAAQAQRGTILDVERQMARATDGHGWAAALIGQTCFDSVANKVSEQCERRYAQNRTGRDNDRTARESYLTPTSHRAGFALRGPELPPDATCHWTLWDRTPPGRQFDAPCNAEIVSDLAYGLPTHVSVSVRRAGSDELVNLVETTAEVRDLLIAGMGDSIASGEGNPDRAVALSDSGFCFRRILGSSFSEFVRPSRAAFKGVRDCGPTAPSVDPATSDAWIKAGADWQSPSCHRSLYSYQARVALALAVENPHVAVTFLPLACTGAQIENGLLGSMAARELPKPCNTATASGGCSSSVPSQLSQLQRYMKTVQTAQPSRPLDLILLTVGANDIGFSAMVASAMVDRNEYEYSILNRFGMVRDVKEATKTLEKELVPNFKKLRNALKPLVGGSLDRVVYVRYGNPALEAPGKPCGGGKLGVDIHPAFELSAAHISALAEFSSRVFFPRLAALATCGPGGGCTDAAHERMTFVDSHDEAFAYAGFCARTARDPGIRDPEFDTRCFKADGSSFRNDVDAMEDPMSDEACSADDFRPYAPRARWVRTPNDAYFTAMTYPYGVLQEPQSNHDGLWGLKAAVYGGAIHPTAEGHAAMADAALPAARRQLELEPAVGIAIAPPAKP